MNLSVSKQEPLKYSVYWNSFFYFFKSVGRVFATCLGVVILSMGLITCGETKNNNQSHENTFKNDTLSEINTREWEERKASVQRVSLEHGPDNLQCVLRFPITAYDRFHEDRGVDENGMDESFIVEIKFKNEIQAMTGYRYSVIFYPLRPDQEKIENWENQYYLFPSFFSCDISTTILEKLFLKYFGYSAPKTEIVDPSFYSKINEEIQNHVDSNRIKKP